MPRLKSCIHADKSPECLVVLDAAGYDSVGATSWHELRAPVICPAACLLFCRFSDLNQDIPQPQSGEPEFFPCMVSMLITSQSGGCVESQCFQQYCALKLSDRMHHH